LEKPTAEQEALRLTRSGVRWQIISVDHQRSCHELRSPNEMKMGKVEGEAPAEVGFVWHG
jgi:hypothetical protein